MNDVPEQNLGDNIVNLARVLRWKVHRDPTWRATGADEGYPDLTLVRLPRVIFAEIKTKKGKLGVRQQEWREQIEGGCAEYYVWRPENWFAGEVDRVLR